jgi:MYXO-CTERM domain-containing protein
MRVRASLALLTALAALPAWTAPARADVVRAGPADDVEAILGGLSPGDELVLEDGTYTLTERFSFDLAGTADAPIVIRAADGARPHFHRPDASQNIWDFRAAYVTIRGLELSGGSAGLRVQGADHLTIEGCEIHDTADVALRMNDAGVTYESVRILRNHIHDTDGTGEGMYLGCNRDACRLLNGVIAENYVHHTNRASVTQGDGIELKEGSAGNVIRDNVIHDTRYPCILTYGTVGNGAPNVIERNVMWRCGDHGIQSAADATLRNNIVLSAAASGIAMQPHQNAAPSNLVVVHNTVLQATNHAVRLSGIVGSVVVANNALYAMSGEAVRVAGDDAMLTLAGNVGVGGAPGGLTVGALAADFVGAHWSGAPPIDVYPHEGGGLVAAGDAEWVTEVDFDGRPRGGVVDVGAYAFAAGGGPAWTLAEGFKDLEPGPPPGVDGGVPTPDGGSSTRDASTPVHEGGVPVRDGGAPAPDAGPGGGEDGGCGCRASPGRGGAPVLLPLLALALLARRRGAR